MPPIYEWKCPKCATNMQVLRHFRDYELPPSKEDWENWEDDLGGCEHEWERTINVPSAYRVWPNTTGRVKGNA